LKIYTRVSPVPTLPPTPPPVAEALPLVMVHGLGVSGRYMVPAAQRLAPRHQVFAPDLPGFGRSDKPCQDLTISELADVLTAWMPAVGIERANFLGNSLGCQVIVDLALRHPQRIHRAILIGPTVDVQGRTMLRQLGRGCRDLWHEPWSLFPILAHDYLVTGTKRMFATFRAALADPIETKFPRMLVPTLIVRGSYDTIVPQRWAEQIARLLPNGKLVVIPGATHAAHFAAPAALALIVNDFLATQHFS
jgi:pimeloyl-ACP methyl ester carboxylesterase